MNPMVERISAACIGAAFLGLGFCASLMVQSCTTQDARTARDIAVRIAADICTEEANEKSTTAPDWVAIMCTAGEGIIAHVTMPRAQWYQVRAMTRPNDAAVGK